MKGQYITMEGKVTTSEPKFYVVFRGDCLVEKGVLVDGPSPKAQPNLTNNQAVQIARVGIDNCKNSKLKCFSRQRSGSRRRNSGHKRRIYL